MAGENVCEICQRERASKACRVCGRKVCARHYDAHRGVCVACAETLCQLCGEKLSIGYCELCGRLICESCSLERGPALVCRECAARGLAGTAILF